MELRPSSAHTWMVCHGYAAMRAAYPEAPDEADNDVREDGTACHWLAHERSLGREHDVGTLTPNQRVVTEEMIYAVSHYFAVIGNWGTPASFEQPLDLSAIHPGMSGTADVSGVNEAARTLHVGDLKYGFRFVEAIDNWQLLCYAIALVVLYRLQRDWKVVLHIVQPRSYHRAGPHRTWAITVAELLDVYLPQLQAGALAASQPGAMCTPNPGCVDCPARHACMALLNAAYTATEAAYAGVPHELSPAHLGKELIRLKDAAKMLEARITGMETQAESFLRNGSVVLGWKLAPSFARESWIPGAESQLLTLASQYYGVDLAKPRALISPAQARLKFPAALVDQFTHKPSTGVKLVKTSKCDAQRAFSGDAT